MIRTNELIALIPARGSSKGIKNKNIRLLNEIPLIAYSIKAALECKVVKRVIVSTDDKKIASIAKEYGAEVPFIRPSEIASDTTPDKPVIQHCLKWLKDTENYSPDLLAYLRPTTPFKTAELIEKCFNQICDNKSATSLRTVTLVEGVFHPYWMFKSENGKLKPFVKGVNIKDYYRRQMLPTCYRLNGVVDIFRTNVVMQQYDIYGENMIYCEVNEKQAVDIDNEFDLEFAEFIMNR